MADIVDPGKRSWIMSRVRDRDTKPEMAVRRILHGMGFRFRLHAQTLPGKPDIVLPRHRKIIQVHGCFWHQHPGCAGATRPTTRVAFWDDKLDRNRLRDARVFRELEELGWRVLVVWECETRKELELLRMLGTFMDPERSASQ